MQAVKTIGLDIAKSGAEGLELVLAQIAELERKRDAVVEAEASDKASKMTAAYQPAWYRRSECHASA